MKINVYDFDDTIYNGDSSFHFFLYAVKNFKVSFFKILKIIFNAILYLFKLKTTKEFKEIVFLFLQDIDDIDSFVDSFWKKHRKNIKKEFLEILKNNKNNSLLSRFFNDEKSRIRCNFRNSLCSDTPTITWLILFDFSSKIYIRNSFIFIINTRS